MARKTCSICFSAPAKIHGHCHACHIRLKTLRTDAKTAQSVQYLTYRGYVVGLYPAGKGVLKPRAETRSADKLPKAKTLDLNVWCEGFTREKIKEFKACVLSLCAPAVHYVKDM